MHARPSFYSLAMSGLGYVADLLRMRGQVVFCFHSVTDERTTVLPHGRMAVTGDFLSDLIVSFKSRGIACVSLHEAIQRLQRRDRSPFVAFTFDDGYRDNYEVALPIFKQHKVPFTIFLTTGLLDRTYPMWWHVLEHVVDSNAQVHFRGACHSTGDRVAKERAYAVLDGQFREFESTTIVDATMDLWRANPSGLLQEDLFRFALDWEMVREMHSSGLVTFGGHTVSHPLLARLPEDQLGDELEGCHARIAAEIGVSPSFFAYPFGQPAEVGFSASAFLLRTEFGYGFTTCSRPLGLGDLERPNLMPRIMLVQKSQSPVIARAYMSGLPILLKRSMTLLKGSKGNRP